MRVAFIASECEPWAKTGGLGDVVDALARALPRVPAGELAGSSAWDAVGADRVDGPVEVFLPRYRSVPVPPGAQVDRLLRVPDPAAADGASQVGLIDIDADGYRLRLVDLPAAFDREGFYGDAAGDYADNPWRFGMLCRAALEALRTDDDPVDIVHLHDWQASPAVLYRDAFYWGDPTLGRAAFVLTIHNLAYHGWVHDWQRPGLGLPSGYGDAYGIDLLRSAIERAELVNTVSPTFAREALTPEFGMGLDWVLAARGDRFFGILNGLDPTVWDPATDTALAAPYSRTDRSGKARCKAALLSEVGFDPADPGPLLGVIGRLDPQKGFDLVAGAARSLLDAGARLIALGSGDRTLVEGLRPLAKARRRKIALFDRFDRELARRIYAGVDMLLVPSRFEPCGQAQMIAMRYGTPPVVRRTGGLADTVVDAHERPDEGTGFVFDEATAGALLWACQRAIALYGDAEQARWDDLVERAMAADFAWESGPAPAYRAAYRRAVTFRR